MWTREVWTALGAYAKAQAVNAAVLLLLYEAGFAVAGVPWWFVTAFFCWLFSLIPSIGSVLSLGVALFVAWLATPAWQPLAWVGGVWLAIQVVDGFVLSPRAAKHAGVNPFLSIAVTLLGGALFGPIGLILAVPVVAVILIVARARRRAIAKG